MYFLLTAVTSRLFAFRLVFSRLQRTVLSTPIVPDDSEGKILTYRVSRIFTIVNLPSVKAVIWHGVESLSCCTTTY